MICGHSLTCRVPETDARAGGRPCSSAPLRRFKGLVLVAVATVLAACGGGDISEDLRREPLSAAATATAITTAPAYDPDDLYRFFAIAFGAAPGVTYMGQLLEAANAGMSIQAIVNVFTTKPQFLQNYPASLTNSEFAEKLVVSVVGNSASTTAKFEAMADIEAALSLPGWTRGDITYAIFNNLAKKPADDVKWAATAKKMANQVAYAKHFTETMKVDTTDLGTLRAVVSAVTQLTPTTGDLTPAIQQAAGAVSAPLTPASQYVMAYAGGVCSSYVICLVGLDQRVTTPTFGARGELTTYVSVREPADEALRLGTAVVGELGGNSDLSWGRWNGGTLEGKFYNLSFSNPRFPLLTINGFHYVVGRNTVSLPTTGQATYSAVAATRPTPTQNSFPLTGSTDLSASKIAVDFASGAVAFDFTFTYRGDPPSPLVQNYRFYSVGGLAGVASSPYKFSTDSRNIRIASAVGGASLKYELNNVDWSASAAPNSFVRIVPYGDGAEYLALIFHDYIRNAGVVIFKRDGAG